MLGLGTSTWQVTKANFYTLQKEVNARQQIDILAHDAHERNLLYISLCLMTSME